MKPRSKIQNYMGCLIATTFFREKELVWGCISYFNQVKQLSGCLVNSCLKQLLDPKQLFLKMLFTLTFLKELFVKMTHCPKTLNKLHYMPLNSIYTILFYKIKTQIDCFLINMDNQRLCKDCKGYLVSI